MYDPLVSAIVETRRDLDQIAFRYVATLTTLTAVIASDSLTLSSRPEKYGAILLVAGLVVVALMAVRTRDRVYFAINQSVIRIEGALGGFEPGRFVVGEALFDWGHARGVRNPVLYNQSRPHFCGILLLGLLCSAAIVVDAP